jgi:hypothetical protein
MYRYAVLSIAIVFACAKVSADDSAQPLDSKQSIDSERPIETFYQQVEILRQPQFSLQGMFIKQQIRYRIASTFELYEPDEKGTQRAVQTISETQLLEADPLSKVAFEQSLLEMRGHSFTYELDKFSRVLSIANTKDNTKTIELKKPKSTGMLMSTVIDEDGWKELAQLTLFQPPDGRLSRQFSRKTTHDWGALGSWYGRTEFKGRTDRRTGQRFGYQHLLEYIPPNPEDANKQGQLPFTITHANFRTYEAQGEIFYDSKNKRVTSVREVFHAKGSISADMLGAATNVDLEERQNFLIQITRQRTLNIPNKSAPETTSNGEQR